MRVASPWFEDDHDEDKTKAASTVVLRLLQRRFGELPDESCEQVRNLSSDQLATLAVALLDFSHPTDLERWLTDNSA
jgi:hypothetical protein